MTKTTAVIVTYDSHAIILECIANALMAGVANIIIWDNSLNDITRKVVEQIENDKVLFLGDGKNYGFGGAINRAIQAGNVSGNILLLNPDCLIGPDTLRSLKLCLEDPMVGIVAPRMRYQDGDYGIAGGPNPTIIKEALAYSQVDKYLSPRMRSWGLGLFHRRGTASLGATREYGEELSCDWVSAFCALTSADTFARVGGFDDEYFLYFEDVDFCNRIVAAGYRCVIDRRVDALHFESTSTSSNGKSAHYLNGLSTYWGKHGNDLEAFVAKRMRQNL